MMIIRPCFFQKHNKSIGHHAFFQAMRLNFEMNYEKIGFIIYFKK